MKSAGKSKGNKRVRILYLGNHAGIFLSHRLPVFKKMVQSGFEVHVAVPAKPDLLSQNIDQNSIQTIKESGFQYHDIKIHRSSTNIKKEICSFVDIFKLLKLVKPDLVYNATQKPVLYGSLISKIVKTPCVVNSLTGLGFVFTDKGIKASLLKIVMKLFYRYTLDRQNSMNIFHNHDDRNYFLAKGIVNKSNSIVIKGSGVNLNEFIYQPEPDDSNPIIIFPSRLLKDKGVLEFVGAAEQVKLNNIKARFVLVGDIDPLNPTSVTKKEVQLWEKNELIEWWGWRKDMPFVYQQASIVCLPSYREGMSKSLIEGLASGRPVVTTDVPGCREIIANPANGFLVNKKDSKKLGDALAILIKDKELRQTMGRNSRELAKKEFSLEIVVNDTMTICKNLIEKYI
jgi:glycosyltransferase involved in cell wall biosynthesis